VVDSLGTDSLLANAAGSGAITAAVTLKGASTVADPSDVDEGYIIEVAVNLDSLGYEAGSDEVIWIGADFYDGDELDPAENSYGTRTWWIGERNVGPAVTAFLDETLAVGVEEAGELPESLRLMGNYPNPFNPTTTIRYALPASAEVQVQIFDVLGRLVGNLAPGVQGAGVNELSFDAAGFASGLYLYRVQMLDAATGVVNQSVTGRMMLVK
jgi:hypothetical protein